MAVKKQKRQKSQVDIHVWMRPDLAERLKILADRDHRSTTGQARHYIEKMLETEAA